MLTLDSFMLLRRKKRSVLRLPISLAKGSPTLKFFSVFEKTIFIQEEKAYFWTKMKGKQ